MPTRSPIWGNLALALGAPLAFFSLCEGILFLAGTRPLSLTEDPYVGFAATQPLFVDSVASNGDKFKVTNPAKLAHFNHQVFPAKKAPGTFRIFSVGGSTAYGHPWRDPVSFSGWLRELLPEADPARKWEVINAGGISYASYREAMLIAELAGYEPDLFLVYSGHNEFLEERTYRNTADIPVPVRELSSLLDQTRTYSALRRLARRLQAGNARSGPGASASAPPGKGSAFNMAGEVDDVLAKTIGPTSYVRDDALKRNVLDHYRVSLERMARLAHDAGAEILFMTTPGNEKDCSPFKSEPGPGIGPQAKARIEAWMAKAAALPEGSAEAMAYCDSAVAADGRNASVLYRAAGAALASGDAIKAKSLFGRSIDEDVCPLRAQTAMRGIVLETARNTRSQSLDVAALLERKTRTETGNDVLGEPIFVDHVHLSIEDYRFLALAILEKMAGLGMAGTGPEWKDAAFQGNPAVTETSVRVMAKMGPRELGEGLHNLAKVVNWAGKHEDAARIAVRALATDSTGLEAIWSSLFVGAALERRGDEDGAILHYRRAVRLDPANPLPRGYLAGALKRKGMDREAAVEFAAAAELDPGDAEIRAQLGTLLVSLGRPAEAVPHLSAAIAAFPDRSDLRDRMDEAMLGTGRAPEAEARFRESLARNPRDVRALVGLARIAESKGDLPEAINLYARALSVEPDLPEARAALSRALGGMPVKP